MSESFPFRRGTVQQSPSSGPPSIAFGAIIVAGGRASRLGGIDKSALVFEGRSLLVRCLAAVAAAERVSVVGGGDDLELPPHAVRTRESPKWGGPAAAIAAGVSALQRGTSPLTAVVAGDLPRVELALPLLLEAAGELGRADDGVIAVDGAGRRQPLLAVYRTDALRSAVRRVGKTENLPVRVLLDHLVLRELRVPTEWSADVDTPEDAARLGIVLPDGHPPD